jgi:membrane-bound lytic murein transglycosylase D
VARDNHVSVAELAEANQMEESAALSGVEGVVIPTAPVVSAAAPRALMYTARNGDTLVTIADRFGVSLDELRRWNKLQGVKVEPGKRLRVGEAGNAPRGARTRHHAAAREESSAAEGGSTAKSKSHGSATPGKNAESAKKSSSEKHAKSAKGASTAKKSDAGKSDGKPAAHSGKKHKAEKQQ